MQPALVRAGLFLEFGRLGRVSGSKDLGKKFEGVKDSLIGTHVPCLGHTHEVTGRLEFADPQQTRRTGVEKQSV